MEPVSRARILFVDIETAPHRAYIWGLWQQNVGPDWVEAAGYVLCYTAKWLGGPVMFDSIPKSGADGMIQSIHSLLDEADIVVHYNGSKFDIPILQMEFAQRGMTPPAPYHQLDLLKEVRRNFRFPSNKLDYVTRRLGQKGKVQHRGVSLWLDCMAGKPEAWVEMERYNRRDVTELERLYRKLLPWLRHPNVAMIEHRKCCPNCGAKRLEKRGEAVSATGRYQRYQCRSCGKWSREARSYLTRDESAQIPRHC